jgi:hypothetical protein
MRVEVVVVVKALLFSLVFFSKRLAPLKEYLKAPETRGLFCSFEICGQYVKKNGRIISVACLVT